MQCLYAMELTEDVLSEAAREKIIEGLKANAGGQNYGDKLRYIVIDHVFDIDDKIKKASTSRDLKQISVLDKILIRCSIAEMMYMTDIPVAVSITEAVQLSKKYSTDESSRFVNGVLDSVSKTLSKIPLSI